MTQLSVTGPERTTVVRLLMLLVTLVGVFAMHGLSDHGASAHTAMAAPADSMSMTHGGTDDQLAPMSSESVETAGQDPTGHSGLGLAGLCLAILAAAVLGFTFLRRRVMTYLSSWSPRVGRPRPRSAGRDRDPPDLVRLCIQRC